MKTMLDEKEIGTLALCLRARSTELKRIAETIGYENVADELNALWHLAEVFGIRDTALFIRPNARDQGREIARPK